MAAFMQPVKTIPKQIESVSRRERADMHAAVASAKAAVAVDINTAKKVGTLHVIVA